MSTLPFFQPWDGIKDPGKSPVGNPGYSSWCVPWDLRMPVAPPPKAGSVLFPPTSSFQGLSASPGAQSLVKDVTLVSKNRAPHFPFLQHEL